MAARRSAAGIGIEIESKGQVLFLYTLIEAVDKGVDLIVLVSDSTSKAKIAPFKNRHPDRFVNVGIAEQCLIGTAAGMALGGVVSVTANAAPFLVHRANEQVKNDVCYTNSIVKLVGLSAGVCHGALGGAHHAIDDVSIMRGFGAIIFAPSDPLEAEKICRSGGAVPDRPHHRSLYLGDQTGMAARERAPVAGAHPIRTLGATVKWFRDQLGLIVKSADTESMAQAVEDNGGVHPTPGIQRNGRPHWKMDARAVIVGLTFGAKKNHIAWAALESAAFQIKDVIQAMQQDSGAPLSELKVDGGMTGNRLLMQLTADLLEVRVVASGLEESRDRYFIYTP